MSRDASRDSLRPEQVTVPRGHALARLPWIGGVLGIAAAGLAFVSAAGDAKAFAFAWLFAVLFFLSLALGALYFVLIHFAMQGGWAVVIRRLAENTMGTLPLFALLFLPVLWRMGDIYPWVHPHEGDHLLFWKAPFLNTPFFVLRAVVYFTCWSVIAFVYVRMSHRQDTTKNPAISKMLRGWAGPAIIVLAVTHTFAAVDWIMSLDPYWYSTIFGVYWFAGSFVSFVALLTLIVVTLRRSGLMTDLVGVEHFHDLGKLLFAFTVFWAYIGFSQYFLIWYGNIPEETIFFRHRLHGSWSAVSLLLACGHFAVPFFFFMARTVKRRPSLLAVGASWMLVMHAVDLYWLIMPVQSPHGVHVGLTDVLAFLAVGGLFLAVLGRLTTGSPLIPLGDPRLPESLSFENL